MELGAIQGMIFSGDTDALKQYFSRKRRNECAHTSCSLVFIVRANLISAEMATNQGIIFHFKAHFSFLHAYKFCSVSILFSFQNVSI